MQPITSETIPTSITQTDLKHDRVTRQATQTWPDILAQGISVCATSIKDLAIRSWTFIKNSCRALLAGISRAWNSYFTPNPPPPPTSSIPKPAAIPTPLRVPTPTLAQRNGWMSPHDRKEWESLKCYKDQLIIGFLEIVDDQVFAQGGSSNKGIQFCRLMLKKFININEETLSTYRETLINVGKALNGAPREIDPKGPRAYVDASITGWDNHCITRLVGSVGSSFQSTGPIFEVLVNSQRPSKNNTVCSPFFTSILPTREQAIKRWELLNSIKRLPDSNVRKAFYPKKRLQPLDFLNSSRDRFGGNSTRLLKGLHYLGSKQLHAQSVGNCWLKQPMRSVLTSLYIETLTNRPELDNEAVWKLAKFLYLKWQDFLVDEIEQFVEEGGISADLSRLAREKIIARRNR
jgi:hypothetical protein